jgi:hypothetical protein
MAGGEVECGSFAFFLTNVDHLQDQRRCFELTPDDIALLNPNTRTCPVFRTPTDADLTKSIYRRVPVLVNEERRHNSWRMQIRQGLFHLTNDSKILPTASALLTQGCSLRYPNEFVSEEHLHVPLYEGKMIQMYEHRAAGVEVRPNNVYRPAQPVSSTPEQLADPTFLPCPQLWAEASEVTHRVPEGYKRRWAFAYKDVTATTNERTSIVCVLPNLAAAYTLRVVFIPDDIPATLVSCLIGTLGSLTYDYLCRQALSGLHLSDYIVKQCPVPPPESYSPQEIDFVAARVLELVYTAWDVQPFAQDLGYSGPPFEWDEERRAHLRAQLDAFYFHKYGLSEEETRYVLDPKAVHGEDFPGETFRVLKDNEIRKHGEYRTQRLVLDYYKAWAEGDMHRFEGPPSSSTRAVRESLDLRELGEPLDVTASRGK